MAKKKKAGAIPPEQQSRLCPQCFTRHFVNDVLFISKRTTKRCDMRNAIHRYTFGRDQEFLNWCTNGRSSVLVDWRAVPETRRRWNGGIIQAVQDIDGTWLDEKACPCCHVPFLLECPVIFGWNDKGLDCAEARRMLAEATPRNWRGLMYDGTQPLPYDKLEDAEGRQILGVPAGIEKGNGSWGTGCRSRMCMNADGVVILLRFAENRLGGITSLEAERSLLDLLDHCGYTGNPLELPVVVLLEGIEAENPMQTLESQAPPIRNCLKQCFGRTYILSENKRNEQQWTAALRWLVEETKRTED